MPRDECLWPIHQPSGQTASDGSLRGAKSSETGREKEREAGRKNFSSRPFYSFAHADEDVRLCEKVFIFKLFPG